MTKELKNRILENKVLTHDERMEIIKALEIVEEINKEQVKVINSSEIDIQKFTEAMKHQPLQVVNHLSEQVFRPSDDCVSRKAMLNAITEIDDNTNMDIYTNEVREIINELPPVTPTRKSNPTYLDCQKCENFRNPDYSKCKNCGKGEGNNEKHII